MNQLANVKQQLENCRRAFIEGTLTEAQICSVLAALDDSLPRQQLLFLRTGGTTIDSDVVGMLRLNHGQLEEGPEAPEEWPYQTVVDAIQDGWRVIKFPELSLAINETRTYEVGCEFVLEKSE